jgi:hypothetical protein
MAESNPGGSTRSSQPTAEPPTGRNLSRGGLDGQGDSGNDNRLRISEQYRNALDKAGVTDFGLSVTEDHQAFSDALERMRSENVDRAAVDAKSVAELEGSITFMNADGTAGGAVEPDGEVVAVFKNRKRNKMSRAGVDVMLHAVALGGNKCDCYGSFLVDTYARAGMVPVARVEYARGFNPEMDAYTIHECRHTTATALAKAGAQPAVIAEIMRHTSYSQTLEYAHIDRETKIKAITPALHL